METLRIPQRLIDDLEDQAMAAFPEECCGVLLGCPDLEDPNRARSVTRLWPSGNSHEGSRESRYTIAPEELLQAHQTARSQKHEILGYYHSHPNAEAIPSSIDLADAGPGASYLIVGVEDGGIVDCRSWRLRSDERAFEEECLIIGAGHE